jgi:hypothetical protein
MALGFWDTSFVKRINRSLKMEAAHTVGNPINREHSRLAVVTPMNF